MYRSSTSEMAFVTPQAMYWLCPMTIPGVPGKLTPITSISPATRWHSYQIDGAAWPRCGSLQRIGIPVVVIVPSTTQLLLAPIIPNPLNCFSCSYCSSIPRFEFCGSFGAQFSNNTSAYHFGFPVSAQVPTHHLGPLNTVLDPPGFRFEAQKGKFNWKFVLITFDKCINAL